jgi:predicted transposase/invertase (TIGR01784 family)
VQTDSLFYKLFQKLPRSFFELIGQPPGEAEAYQFTSVEIKQPTFRIDGVFKPADDRLNRPIYFIEVQFQPKSDFYWRFFAEIFLYLEQEKPAQDWQAVAVFFRRSLDPGVPEQYRGLLASQQVTRIYLDELGEAADRSVSLGLVQFIVDPEATARQRAPRLIQQAQQLEGEALRRDIIELMETIAVYKFTKLSRKEIEEMFQLSDLKQTRFYQEVWEETVSEIVPRLLAQGVSVEQIARALELDVEAVRQAAQKPSAAESE